MARAFDKATGGMCPQCSRLLEGMYPFLTRNGRFCSPICAEDAAEDAETERKTMGEVVTKIWPTIIPPGLGED